MKLKKFLVSSLAFLLLFSAVGCGGKNTGDLEEQKEFSAPYVTAVSESGKGFIKHGGESVLLLSSQIAADLLIVADGKTPAELEPYFAVAAETGFNSVDIPILWNQVETEKDVYDSSVIRTYLDFAKKYDLKINLLWYGSLKDGETKGYSLPEYILENPTDYTVLKDLYDGGVYGRIRIMKWDDKDLLARESRALYELMNAIYAWNGENGNYDPVVTLQIGQGTADRFYRWRIDQYKIEGAEGLMTQSEAEEMIARYIESLAAAVKKSAYRPLVRLEFCEQGAVTEETLRVYNLENVDLICPTYLHTVAENRNGTSNFASDERLNGMPVINAENWASDINYRQVLTTIVSGGIGYNSYLLSPPKYYPMSPNGAIFDRIDDEGETIEEKFISIGDRSADTKKVMTLILNAPYTVSVSSAKNIVALNMNNRLSVGDVQKSYVTYADGDKGVFLDYVVAEDEKALGFAAIREIDGSVYLYVSATSNSSIQVSRANVMIAQKGKESASGEWTSEGNVDLAFNNKGIVLEANVLYRLKLSNVEDMLSGKELAESGYESPLTSLRG